jgi:hypothetical protein
MTTMAAARRGVTRSGDLGMDVLLVSEALILDGPVLVRNGGA